jgi:putative ABC transport system ATP-binding protein
MELLKKFQIEHTLHQNISDLSGGQQQRVSIARVLTKKPRVIFADEPTGNLDSQTAKEVMTEMIKYIKSVRGTMLIVTHDKNIASMSDTIYQLKNKKLSKIHANH